MGAKKTVVKEEPEVTPEVQKAIDLAIATLRKDMLLSADVTKQLAEMQEKTLATLEKVSQQAVPADSKVALEQQAKDFEDPYIRVGDKVGVLTVSTADLRRMDGAPGEIYQNLPGQVTKQGLQKRLVIPVELYYDPGVNSRYSFDVMDRKDYDEKVAQRHGVSGIPNASMVAAMSARAGEDG